MRLGASPHSLRFSCYSFQLRLPLVIRVQLLHPPRISRRLVFIFCCYLSILVSGDVIMFDHSRNGHNRTKSVFLFGLLSIVSLLGVSAL